MEKLYEIILIVITDFCSKVSKLRTSCGKHIYSISVNHKLFSSPRRRAIETSAYFLLEKWREKKVTAEQRERTIQILSHFFSFMRKRTFYTSPIPILLEDFALKVHLTFPRVKKMKFAILNGILRRSKRLLRQDILLESL